MSTIYDLWQVGYTGQRNMGTCDVCYDDCANRRVGKTTTYWVCGPCTHKFQVRQLREMRRKQAAENAQAGAGGGA